MAGSVFSRAAVAAPHAEASEIGFTVLQAGGNALEAMVAMAAMIAVVYPHMNSIGGDGFWLIREPSGKLRYLEACGFAGAGATIAAYRAAGHDFIPVRGPLAALTVPGAVGGWSQALGLSKALGGRLPLADLIVPAARRASEGYPISAAEARSQHREPEALAAAPGFAQAFLAAGERPKAGDKRRAPELGQTLDRLAHAGLEDFYRGDVARELAADMERLGLAITREDLAKYRAIWREPLTLRLPGVTLANSQPPTQGLASLIILGVFDKLHVRRAESFEHIHGLIEASKRAIAVRDRVCVDFDRLRDDPASFLSESALEREASAISMTRAARFPAAEDAGDTVWMGAIDERGLAVSYIQSVFWEYGSGCVLPRTGVHLQNRGTAFSLDPSSANALAPGRRPFHTLNPALALYNDGAVMSYGSMGGDGQPQFQAQVYTRIAFGADLADAIERPRFLLGRTWGAPSVSLKLEPRFDTEIVDRLRAAGHDVELFDSPFVDACGHAGALRRARDGSIEAAHDPRADGGAAGF
ncbi:MAG TPA: gamma-glutamyltransferase [Beijerinckiaceae bacterium]|nr:gamma-glutamyltransferase [Beijerinckiaceae bacterium]